MKISDTIQSLRNQINDHNYQYYILDNPIISDSEFCALSSCINGSDNVASPPQLGLYTAIFI